MYNCSNNNNGIGNKELAQQNKEPIVVVVLFVAVGVAADVAVAHAKCGQMWHLHDAATPSFAFHPPHLLSLVEQLTLSYSAGFSFLGVP